MSHWKKPFLRSLKYAGKKPSKKNTTIKNNHRNSKKKKEKCKNLTRVEDCVMCEY